MRNKTGVRPFAVAPYLKKALDALCPPENLSVSQWAARYRILSPKSSALPGPWSNDKTPYLTEVMDRLCDYVTEEIIFVKPSQVGGTEIILRTCIHKRLSRVWK